jgi:hypothetical protein
MKIAYQEFFGIRQFIPASNALNSTFNQTLHGQIIELVKSN